MTKLYRVTPIVRIVNRVMTQMIRFNFAPPQTYLLMVRGRKSGKPHTTPVTLVQENGKRWLVALYGEVGWVKNARSAGRVTLMRGKNSETVAIHEIADGERAPILKKYMHLEPIVRPYFKAGPDSPLEIFAAEAANHPVFLVEENTG
jgi:deazaflavin-dependent oxidoreductase (nitroreductase family)